MVRFFYGDRRTRRQAIETGREIQLEAERWTVPGLLFVVFVLPFLVNPSLLLQPAAWLWWVKGYTLFAGLLCLGIYAVAHFWHLPAQLNGAAVDAMQQAGADDEECVPFSEEQPEEPCVLLPQQLARRLVIAERQVSARARQLVHQLWEQPPQACLLPAPYRRTIPLPTLLQEPSA